MGRDRRRRRPEEGAEGGGGRRRRGKEEGWIGGQEGGRGRGQEDQGSSLMEMCLSPGFRALVAEIEGKGLGK